MTNGELNIAPVEKAIQSVFSNSGKSIEKFLLYVIGILTQTGILHTGSSKEVITGAVAAVLTGLHISTKP